MDYKQYLGFLDNTKDRAPLRDGSGRMRTQSMFYEMSYHTRDTFTPLYSLRSDEVNGLSAYQIYMHSVDETEAAYKLVGSLEHWRKLTSKNDNGNWTCPWLMEATGIAYHDGVVQWREDMRLRDEMFAKRKIMEAVEQGNVGAAKILLDSSKKVNKVGRPEGADLKRKNDRVSDLVERGIGLSVVK